MIFKHLRKFIKTIMWGIAILIVPAFVLYGVGSAVKNRRSGYAGELFGEKVPWDKYQQAKQAVRNNAWMQYGDELEKYINLEEQTWTRLILLHEAKQKKIKVSKEELFTYIKSLPLFSYNNLDSENYTMLTARLFNQTTAEFEAGIQGSILTNKLMENITDTLIINDAEIKESYVTDQEKATASYVLIQTTSYLDQISVDNEENLTNYYQTHKEEFKTQEQVNVEYIEIKLDPFKKNIVINDERIDRYYENNKEDYVIAAEEKKDKDDESAETPKEEPKTKYKLLAEVKDSIKNKLVEKEMNNLASEKARKILHALYADANLGKAAQQNGLTVQQTGPFSMAKEIPGIGLNFQFLKTAFSLQTGDISEIIKSPSAYYILKPIKKIEPYVAEYSVVKDQVKQAYQQTESKVLAEKEAGEILKNLKDSMQNKSLSFEDAAKQLKLDLKTAENFTRNGYIKELGFAEDFTKTAFSLPPQKVSELVNTSRGFCILSLKTITPIDEALFETEKEKYREKILAKKRNEYLNKWFEKLKQTANPVSYEEKNKLP
ncbi:MAG: hypothetical protein GY853_03475 [PVC group bacterium]|nr:hypothetical protein [PVC group bacterium]